ncbi:MAG: hypothetical protein NT093_00095 [Candidatus Moranbacteria bacterium]|nr:hypothetical protein [Candidatus Moranbacteria bacterium]
MGMLKSRADELERRLNQIREVLRGSEKNLEHFVVDIKLLANDAEKVEDENIQLKRDLENQGKELEKVIKERDLLAKQQK